MKMGTPTLGLNEWVTALMIMQECLQQGKATQEIFNWSYFLNLKLYGFLFKELPFSQYSSLHSS